jgi:hypothetical protein
VLHFADYDSSDFVTKFDLSSLMQSSVNADWNTEWNSSRREMEFVPGRFQMEITQYPKVTIEYLGDQDITMTE